MALVPVAELLRCAALDDERAAEKAVLGNLQQRSWGDSLTTASVIHLTSIDGSPMDKRRKLYPKEGAPPADSPAVDPAVLLIQKPKRSDQPSF